MLPTDEFDETFEYQANKATWCICGGTFFLAILAIAVLFSAWSFAIVPALGLIFCIYTFIRNHQETRRFREFAIAVWNERAKEAESLAKEQDTK